MNINKSKIIVLLGLIMLLFYSGCASSSAAKRYGVKGKKSGSDSSRVVKFKNDYKKAQSDTLDAEYQDMEEEPDTMEYAIDSTLIKKLIAKYADGNSNPGKTNYKEKVIMEIIRYLNTPYRYGGTSWDGIDCSAFTQSVFNNTFSFELPRSAREQYQVGQVIEDKTELKFGDLVFFNTRRRVRPGHVGIYIGENLFAHASRTLGVTVSSLEENYYIRRYMGARRLEGLPFN